VELTLACLKSALGLVDHVKPAFAAHNTVVAVPLSKRLERIADFHGFTLTQMAQDVPGRSISISWRKIVL